MTPDKIAVTSVFVIVAIFIDTPHYAETMLGFVEQNTAKRSAEGYSGGFKALNL